MSDSKWFKNSQQMLNGVPKLGQTTKSTPEAMLQICAQGDHFNFLDGDIKIEATDDTHESKSGDKMPSSQIPYDSFETSNLSITSDGEYVIVLHMDIQNPLYILRPLLEEEVGRKLNDFSFSLQDAQPLEEHKNLTDLCSLQEGWVQINVELLIDEKGKRINIIDVLQPSEEDKVEIEEALTLQREDDVEDESELPRKELEDKSSCQEKNHPLVTPELNTDSDQHPLVTPELNTDSDQLREEGYHATISRASTQLWRFLLDLLTDKDNRNIIQWLNNEGEFKLIKPELVASLWGLRKNKPNMNFEELSRTICYYCVSNKISKVFGKQFVYRFDCDLKMILGYSSLELKALVIEAELKTKQKN